MNDDHADVPDVDPVARVAAARSPHADPVRFRVVEALARRAAVLQGEARQVLLDRIDVLLAALATATPVPAADTRAPASALAALSTLVDRLGRAPGVRAVRPANAPVTPQLSRTVSLPPLKATHAFKGTWSRLRAEHRLRQAVAQVPASAGPLNSSNMVNRALQAMHDLSPEYLDAFMSHVDTLQWLEQTIDVAEAARPAGAAEGKRKPGARAAGRKS